MAELNEKLEKKIEWGKRWTLMKNRKGKSRV